MLGFLNARCTAMIKQGGAGSGSSLALRLLLVGRNRMSTQTPPPDAARGATADLCDTFITDPVDVVNERNVQIMDPVFRNYGGNSRFKGQAATVKCFENNPLVRKVSQIRKRTFGAFTHHGPDTGVALLSLGNACCRHWKRKGKVVFSL